MTKFLKKLQSMEIHTIFRIKKELRERHIYEDVISGKGEEIRSKSFERLE